MDPLMIALIAVLALFGFAIGALAVPRTVDYILRAKYAAFCTWWNSMLALYGQWFEEHRGEDPSPKAHGHEGALGIWVSDCRRLAREGELTREQVSALKASGFEV